MNMDISFSIYINHFIVSLKLFIMKKFYNYFSMMLIAVFFGFSAQAQNITVPLDGSIPLAADTAADGAVITIAQGIHISDSVININNKSLTFIGEEGDTIPLVLQAAFQLLGEKANLKLVGLELSGAAADSVGEELVENLEDVEDYFINHESSLLAADSIVIRDCQVRNYQRALVRADRAVHTVGSYVIDNCIFTDKRHDSYPNFRFKKNIDLGSLTITNSTFYSMFRQFIDISGNDAATTQALVRNCTFNDVGGYATKVDHFIDFKSESASLTLQNCIFGLYKNIDALSDPDTVFTGKFDMEEAAYFEIVACAFDSDWKIAIDMEGTYEDWDTYSAWAPLDKNQYNQVLDIGFADPDNGDFTLPEDSPLLDTSDVGGIIGDPRWDPNYGVGLAKHIIESSMEVYPNPASDMVNIYIDKLSVVKVYNIAGQKVMERQLESGKNEVSISSLAQGIYFLRNESDNSTTKLIVK